MNWGAAAAGISQGIPQGIKDAQGIEGQYEAGLNQASQIAVGRALQMLQMQQNPSPPIPGTQGIPGVNGQQAQPQPPMGSGQPQGQMPMGGGGPPMPQGSPPMGAPQQAPMPPPQMQGPMGGAPAGPMQQQQGGGGGFDIRQIIGAIVKANPGAPPQVIAGATEHAIRTVLPVQLREQALQQAMQLGLLRADVAVRGQDVRADTTERGQDVRAQTAQGAQDVAKRGQDVRAATQEKAQTGIQDRFNVREARITAHQMVTADQAWQRLDQQRKQAEARGDVTVKRAALDALHKRTMEIIQAWSQNSQMPPETRKQLLKDADEAYNNQIRDLGKGNKSSFGERFQGGGESSP